MTSRRWASRRRSNSARVDGMGRAAAALTFFSRNAFAICVPRTPSDERMSLSSTVPAMGFVSFVPWALAMASPSVRKGMPRAFMKSVTTDEV